MEVEIDQAKKKVSSPDRLQQSAVA